MVMEITKKHSVSARRYYVLYTVLFIVLALLVYVHFIVNGKSFIYCDVNQGGDGLVQHFNAFVYYGKYLREIIKSVLIEHQLQIPMWDLSIGYGQDIITTLSYYVIGDPFSFLSVFCPTAKAEYAYCFLILLRIYLSGVTFSVYCRYRKKDSWYTLIGAFIYAFSYYTLSIAVLHPYFMLPVIYLPLLLMGADKVLKKEGDRLFIIMVAIAGISNFYFFFMLCILVIIYVIFRYLQLFGRIRIGELSIWFIHFLLDAILGVGMAAILLLPSIINILSSSRIAVENYVPLTYELKYYLNLIPSFINGGGSYYAHMGYTALGLIAVAILFMRRKERKTYQYLCAGFILLAVFLIVPFCGHFFNGMSYVTNRWIWALAFLVAYITVTILPLLETLSGREWMTLFIVAGIISSLIVGLYVIRTEKNMWAVYGLAVTLLILYVIIHLGKQQYLMPVCVLLTIGAISVNALYIYSPTEGNYLKNFTNMGSSYKMLTKDAPEYILKKIDDDSVYRFDTMGFNTGDVKRNSAIELNMYGTAYYFSSTNGTISKFISDMYLNSVLENSFNNLDRRSWLDAIAAVKYFVIPDGQEKLLPYGYNQKVIENGKNAVYTSENALPFGFTSSVIIGQDEFDTMDVVEKQQALLQGIVLDGAGYSGSDETINFDGVSVVPEVTKTNGVEFEEGAFIVKESGGTVTLLFDGLDNSELYLIWEGLKYQGINPVSLYDEAVLNKMSSYEKNTLKRNYQYWQEPVSAGITASAEGSESETTIYTWKNPYYCGHHNFLCNMGYSENARNSVTLKFDQVGVYSFDSMKIVNQPMDKFDLYCSELQKDVLENIEIGTNTISGEISLKEDKALCLPVPYSQGWSAEIDGENAELLRADDMFMGLMLPAGTHQIELRYTSPYLKEGGIISIVSWLMFVCLVMRNKREQKYENMASEK